MYRAEDTVLGRIVAIKLLRGPEATPAVLEQANSESAVLTAMEHPSLVTLYDARLDPAHPQYLAMEYIDGPTLYSRLAQGPLPVSDVASLGQDIGGALQAVHEAGIIHRDVKPSNILFSTSGQNGGRRRAKLTDFGIALGRDNASPTSPDGVVGTAGYLAPEQIRRETLTPAVDVYALGLVLTEAMTGEPAFPLSGGEQADLRHLTGPPPLPDSIKEDWRELLVSMMRSEPTERPTAGEVVESIPDPPSGEISCRRSRSS